jgi:hypothetical protein
MRPGWTAFLVSLAIHGAAIGVFYFAPGARIVRNGDSFLEDGPDGQLEIATIELCERTETFDTSSTPPMKDANQELAKVRQTGPEPEASPRSTESPVKPTKPAQDTSIPGSRSGAPDGMPAGVATTFFNVPARGQTIVYLIDASASMGLHGALQAARAELLRSVRRLPESVRFQIIVFNRLATPLLPQRPEWLNATPQVLATVAQALSNLTAEGVTDPVRALKYALSRRPAVLFFLTDAGEFRTETAREATRFNAGRSVIHVIELRTGQAASNDLALRMLAHDNRGTFKTVTPRQEHLSYQSP